MKFVNRYEVEYKTASQRKFMTIDLKEEGELIYPLELIPLINELLKEETEKIEEIIDVIYLGEYYKEEVKITNIIWDIDLEDDEEYSDAVKLLKLPETVDLEVYVPDDEDIDDVVADILTEKYEFCVVGFTINM